MSDEKPKKEKHNSELIMDEFLFKTLVSLQVTLSTISKDLEQKTEVMHDMTDSLTAITYNMKEVREKLEQRCDECLYKNSVGGDVQIIRDKIQLLEVKFESDNTQLQGHVKEMKYAIQQLSDSLIELKMEKKIKLVEEVKEKKKFDFGEMVSNAWGTVKGVRTIFYILLAIVIMLAYMFGGNQIIVELFKLISGH